MWNMWSMLLLGAMTASAAAEKPVLLYATVFHAQGAEEYAADGPYADVLERLGETYEVRVSAEPLIANPNAEAVKDGPPPHQMNRNDVMHLANHVANGGGLVFLSNQSSAHNCEKQNANHLLRHFGVQATHYEVGVKRYQIPDETPIVGGLDWAYYYGCILTVEPDHPAQPQVLVRNERAQAPLRGQAGIDGAVLVTAEVGAGRAVIASDAGFVTDWAMAAEGDDRIKQQDNWTLFRRLVDWTAQREQEQNE